MSIAAVIPVHNGETYLHATLESVIAAGGVDHVYVVLDRCTDGTETITRSFGTAVEVIESPGVGVSVARNTGALAAEGYEFVYFVDADDLIRIGAVQRLQNALEEHREAVASYGNYDRIAHDGSPYGNIRTDGERHRPSGDLLDLLLRENVIATNSILIRREAFLASGGFDPNLTHGEDWHLWTRIAALGPIVHVPSLIFDYRMREGSATLTGRPSPQKYLEAVDAIYSDPLIRRRRNPWRLRLSRLDAIGHIFSYMAQQSVRSGRYWDAVKWITRSSLLAPTRAPRRIAILAKTMLASIRD